MLEICPFSNQELFYFPIHKNPFLKLIREKKIPLTINSDDPGFFGYEGVTMDWFYIIMETDVKPTELYLLLKNSVVYAASLTEEEKSMIIEEIQKEFIKFFENLKCPKVNLEDLKLKREESEERYKKFVEYERNLKDLTFSQLKRVDKDINRLLFFLPNLSTLFIY